MLHRRVSAELGVSIEASSVLVMPMAMMKRLVVVVSAAAALSQAGASKQPERGSGFAEGERLRLRTAGRKLVRWKLRTPP